ncbi:2OG-Fe(II) oxygenase family protein [Gammaproteobacteria bacterium AS21]
MTDLESKQAFNPYDKEKALREQAQAWDTSVTQRAADEDIPVIDLAAYFSQPTQENLTVVANQLRFACENVGFFSIVGHQVPSEMIDEQFQQIKAFHALPVALKTSIKMDREDWPVGGVGYLPFKNKKLPSRDTGNRNEAFLLKCDHNLSMNSNQWLDQAQLPGFRSASEAYAAAMVNLAKKLLPIFAQALEVDESFFAQAFEQPHFRLRMTHYPSVDKSQVAQDQFGIAPHVDTSFCTILVQDQPGLSIYSEQRDQWLDVPMIEGAFIVNTGELLRQWSNDRFLSVKHFVHTNTTGVSRYSIPFFFNANSDYVMQCIPSCYSASNPAKYPAISYNGSQAVAQGE